MKSVFYRPNKVNTPEMSDIVTKVREELEDICSGKIASLNDALEYLDDLKQKAKPLSHNPQMAFWGLDDPEKMPSDARVDFFYIPTYCLTAAVIALMIQYPELAEKPQFLAMLKKALTASTGRNFAGHGFGGYGGMLDTMDIFATAPILPFFERFPDLCPEFTNLWQETYADLRKRLETGESKSCPGFGPQDLTSEITQIVKKIEN